MKVCHRLLDVCKMQPLVELEVELVFRIEFSLAVLTKPPEIFHRDQCRHGPVLQTPGGSYIRASNLESDSACFGSVFFDQPAAFVAADVENDALKVARVLAVGLELVATVVGTRARAVLLLR